MDKDIFDFMKDGESHELHMHRIQEEIVAQDWRAEFDMYERECEALEEALACPSNEAQRIFLSCQRDAYFGKMMRAVILEAYTDEVMQDRQEFDANFGYLEQE